MWVTSTGWKPSTRRSARHISQDAERRGGVHDAAALAKACSPNILFCLSTATEISLDGDYLVTQRRAAAATADIPAACDARARVTRAGRGHGVGRVGCLIGQALEMLFQRPVAFFDPLEVRVVYRHFLLEDE